LPLKAGTVILVLDKKEHGWWLGMSTTAPPRKGYFPKVNIFLSITYFIF
jgi:hypothetical protein